MIGLPDPFNVDTSEDGDMAIVAVQGEVDMSTALEMDAELARLVDAGWANIVVDLAGVSFIDSTGLRVLVMAHRRLSDLNGVLALRRPRPRVLHLLQIVNLDHVFPIVESPIVPSEHQEPGAFDG